MQSSSSYTSWHNNPCLLYPVPNHLLTRLTLHSKPRNKNKPHSTNHTTIPIPTLTPTHSCSSKEQEQHKTNNHHQQQRITPETHQYFHQLCSSVEPQLEETEKGQDFAEEGVSSMMRWADVKAALGQRINLEGIVCSFGILSRDKQLVVPHVRVRDVRCIDWGELRSRGFEGVVFDKDNTITVPYSLSLWPPLVSSIEQCKALFGDNVAVFSNSAGLCEYDPDGKKAGAVEDTIGIKVIRHKVKKPAGTAEEIERHFGCESSKLIMVGDRPFTDIVYGNRNGFFTILTDPLSPAEEPLIVRQVRQLEVAIVNQWSKKGIMPISHKLVPDPLKCVKDVPL